MKTRIFHTKFWYDNYIISLTPTQRLLFVFYLTNDRIGLSGIYEMADPFVKLATGLNEPDIKSVKEKFAKDGKILFYKNYVYCVNCEKYQAYTGTKNAVAREKELKQIPKDVKKYFRDRLSIGYVYPIDSPINHKSEIRNKKKGGLGGFSKLSDLKQKDVQEIADRYSVALDKVVSLKESLKLYCQSKGVSYKDYKATLMAWTRRAIDEDKIQVINKLPVDPLTEKLRQIHRKET